MSSSQFDYKNTQVEQHGGKRFIRKVSIKNGKLISSVRKGLQPIEVGFIKIGKFIPGLFKDCPCNKTRKRRKHKKQ